MAEAKRHRASAEEELLKQASKLLLSEDCVKQLSSTAQLVDDALACAVARGIVMYPRPSAKMQANAVPITLLPTPFAEDCYLRAKELGPTFHQLMDRVACDWPWLRAALQKTAAMDVICGRLVGICERVYGIPSGKDHRQDIRLHIMRNDFMLDTQGGGEKGRMVQIELNMIAASFSAHCQDLTEIHRYLLSKYMHRLDSQLQPDRLASMLATVLPESRSAQGIAAAIAAAHGAYKARWRSRGLPHVVLFIADLDEKNELDHRKLEAALFQGHGVVSLRRSLAQLAADKGASLEPLEAQAFARASNEKAKALVVDNHEVSVAYFRSGYWPGQFSPEEECWSARELLEMSEAVKCPSALAQLAGMKKVQQLLCERSQLERFLPPDKAALLSTTFGRQLDPSSDCAESVSAVQAAKADPSGWVLKPQVEGSGELFFDSDIPPVLSSRSREELAEFILMERVRPPVTPSPVMNGGEDQMQVVVRASVSELGIFGTFVADGSSVLCNEVVGHLLRSKGKQTNQGGVFVGNAVVDVPLLVPARNFWTSVHS